MEYVDRVPSGTNQISLPFTIRPLHVAKQMAMIMIAMSEPYMLQNDWFNHLRWLVNTPQASGWPSRVRFFVYLMREGMPRFLQMGVPLDMTTGRSVYVQAEIALPPLGYCFTQDGLNEVRAAENAGLCDVTHFFRYDYRVIDTLYLRMRLLKPVGLPHMRYENE